MRVNLDAVAGAPLHPLAQAAFVRASEQSWADPRAAHAEGRHAANLLAAAREQIAPLLGCRADEVVFDASLSVANRRAIRGLALGRQRIAQRVVATAVEHSSILHPCAGLADGWLLGPGWSQELIPVDRTGAVNAAEVLATVHQSPTSLVAVQWANGEVGTRQPVAEIAAGLEAGTPLLVDASAGLGVDDLRQLPWSVLTATPTTLGAPASCAVLAIRSDTRWRAIDTPSDDYEYGRVPGRPNLTSIAATVAAVSAAWSERCELDTRLRRLTQRLRDEVPRLVADCVVLGSDDRVGHTVTMSFLYVSGAALAAELDTVGFAVGSGSACSSDALTPSHVLAAMGALTEGNLRISLAWDAADADITSFLTVLPMCIERVRERFGAPRG